MECVLSGVCLVPWQLGAAWASDARRARKEKINCTCFCKDSLHQLRKCQMSTKIPRLARLGGACDCCCLLSF
eukprot:scaffold52337_cov21-Tisochrysis_lutea.AAC.1